MTQVVLIRHAKTEGNLSLRYVGRTDEPLCREGKEALDDLIRKGVYPPMEEESLLFVSPMRRCRETASLIYPDAEQRIIDDFRECDFGSFEYRNYEEMQNDPEYQAWIDSGGTMKFPRGEDPEAFRSRSAEAFRKIMAENEKCLQRILVVHGGTVMSLMSAFGEPEAGYFDRCVENGHGFVCNWTEHGTLELIRSI